LQTSVAGLADSKRIKTGLDYREQLPLLRAVFGQVLALLTGLRQGDLLPLEKRHLTDEGIDIVTANTHKRLIIEWSPELRGIIDRGVRHLVPRAPIRDLQSTGYAPE
jgi:integrase